MNEIDQVALRNAVLRYLMEMYGIEQIVVSPKILDYSICGSTVNVNIDYNRELITISLVKSEITV